MAVSKKTTPLKKRAPRKSKQLEENDPIADASLWGKVKMQAVRLRKRVSLRIQGLLARRPHRSFRKTHRRDYVRSLKLPGYWAFTEQVRKVLWQQKKLFIFLTLTYGLLSVALVGIASQDSYSQLGGLLRETSEELFGGDIGALGNASVLLFTGVSGAASQEMTVAQQIYAVILALFTWLTTVWLLRAVVAGRKPRLRDGLYNAGSPILPTFLVGLILVLQLLPIAVAGIGFTAAMDTGLLDSGVEAMLFWTCATLLGALSLYWISSTLIALVVVTLPGIYPMQAIKAAGDLVIGRRVRVLLRILWLLLILAIIWLAIMIPIILFDTWLKGIQPAIEWIPIVPSALLVMSTLSVIWSASYVYLLYRKVVDDDAAPA